MSRNKRELKQLREKYEGLGWEFERTNSGHWVGRFRGGRAVFVPSTPGDRRSVLNVEAKLRREMLQHGVEKHGVEIQANEKKS